MPLVPLLSGSGGFVRLVDVLWCCIPMGAALLRAQRWMEEDQGAFLSLLFIALDLGLEHLPLLRVCLVPQQVP